MVSRTTTVTSESASGKAKDRGSSKQYWTCVPVPRNAGAPKLSCVHAKLEEVDTVKLHERSLSAFEMRCVKAKLGGSTAGTPPSQTAGLPSPRVLLLMTQISGRRFGLSGSLLLTLRPG